MVVKWKVQVFRVPLCLQDNPDARQLLAPSNIDLDRLYQFSYEAASWSTALPRLNFAVRRGGEGGEGSGGVSCAHFCVNVCE